MPTPAKSAAPAAPAGAAPPGSAAAAGTGIVHAGEGMPAPEGPDLGQFYPVDPTIRQPKLGDWVRYVAPDKSDRVAMVIYVHQWQTEFQVEKNPYFVNLYVWAIDAGDAQLWRESYVTRLPGDLTGHAHQVAWQEASEYYLERTHVWRWPDE